MVGDIDTNVTSNVDTSDHSQHASSDQIASHNTNVDDHSSGHNVNIDSHNQTAGGNLSDSHNDSHAQQTTVAGTVINVGPGESVTTHADGSTSVSAEHPAGSSGSHGTVHHDYPHLGNHGAKVLHWKKQLNAVLNAGLPENEMFDQDTNDWTVYFQGQNGLTQDGVVGPQTQSAMDAQYVPQSHQDQGGGYDDRPYHPSTHGQFDPSQHGQFDPNQHGAYHPDMHGPYHPQTHGDFNPYVHGQFDPQMHGAYHPDIHGQYNPQYHGEFNPYVHGAYHPDVHGQFNPEFHGQFHPDSHGQFDPQFHGQFDPQVHGAYDPQMHGEYNEQLHGSYDPQIHGEMAVN